MRTIKIIICSLAIGTILFVIIKHPQHTEQSVKGIIMLMEQMDVN